MDLLSVLESILSRQLAWIAAADAKTSFIFPVASAMCGLLAALAPEPGCWSIAAAVCTAIATLFLVLSILFCAFATFPRTDGPPGSNIYFDGISNRNSDQFISDMQQLDESSHLADLARQCHINAQIASVKFKWVKFALASLFVAALPWVLSLYFLYSAR